VRGDASGHYGDGVRGYSEGANGRGIYGESSGTYGLGVHGHAHGSEGQGIVGGASGEHGIGVEGHASYDGLVTNYGGFFTAEGQHGRGVYGHANNAGGGENFGGYFVAEGKEGRGVCGYASNNGPGMNYGGYFASEGQYGYGVYSWASGGNSTGVYGASTRYGIYGNAWGDEGKGVYGYAYGPDAVGVWGKNTAAYAHAGYFVGDVGVADDLYVMGDKYFVQPHPADPSKELLYVCLEGGESGVYVRGSGNLEGGRAEVQLPEHFSLVAAEEGLTVQITPRDGKAGGYLYVEEVSPSNIVVVEAGGTSDASFDYLVMGVRRGFEKHEVIQENRHIKPEREMSQKEYEDWLALPENRGMQRLLIENRTLTPEGKINQETAQRLGWELGPKTNTDWMKHIEVQRPELEVSRE
jgi:hypothetical protein